MYFRTLTQAARAARGIRESRRVSTAFLALRAGQVRASQVRPVAVSVGMSPVLTDYHRALEPAYNNQGLPFSGWPLGATWIAYTGQSVRGAVGGILR